MFKASAAMTTRSACLPSVVSEPTRSSTHSILAPSTGIIGRHCLPGAGPSLLASASVAAGADAVLVEVHEAPERALSDGANALRLDKLWGTGRETAANLVG